jgi:hypothetical protein
MIENGEELSYFVRENAIKRYHAFGTRSITAINISHYGLNNSLPVFDPPIDLLLASHEDVNTLHLHAVRTVDDAAGPCRALASLNMAYNSFVCPPPIKCGVFLLNFTVPKPIARVFALAS